MNRLTGFLHRVDGHAQNHAASYLAADISRSHILLAYMDALRAAGHSYRHIVVDDEGDTVLLAQGMNFFRLLQKILIAHVLFPKLYAGDATAKRFLHLLIQCFLSHPSPVGDGIEQHIFFIALHTWLPSPAPPE